MVGSCSHIWTKTLQRRFSFSFECFFSYFGPLSDSEHMEEIIWGSVRGLWLDQTKDNVLIFYFSFCFKLYLTRTGYSEIETNHHVL